MQDLSGASEGYKGVCDALAVAVQAVACELVAGKLLSRLLHLALLARLLADVGHHLHPQIIAHWSVEHGSGVARRFSQNHHYMLVPALEG